MSSNSQRITRRVLAWGLAAVGALTIAFVTVWGAIYGIQSYVTLGVGVFGGSLSTVAVFYFSKED